MLTLGTCYLCVYVSEGEAQTVAPTTQDDGPPSEGPGSEGAIAPVDSVPPTSEAPSEAGAKSEVKSEKGTTKSKGDSKPGELQSD